MPDWTKLSSRDVYVVVAKDIADSFHRYFAPVVGLIQGVEGNVDSGPAAWQKKKLEQDKKRQRDTSLS